MLVGQRTGGNGIHPNQSKIQKMVFTIQNYFSSVGYKPAGCNVPARRQIKKEIKNGKVMSNWNSNGHIGYNAFG